MKKSRRLLRNTIVVLNVLMAAYIGVNRIYAGNDAQHGLRNTTATELANLRDFSTVEIHGDFKVELVQQAEFSVAYEPMDGNSGRFSANTEGDTLFLYGHGNRAGDVAATVKIGMPALRRVEIHDAASMQISGFADPVLAVQFDHSEHLVLRNNTVKEWHLGTAGRVDVEVDKTSLAASKIVVHGAVSIVQIE